MDTISRKTPKQVPASQRKPTARKGAAAKRVWKGGARRNLQQVGVQIKVPVYYPAEGVQVYVSKVRAATPIELVTMEKQGVRGRLLKDLALRMEIPAGRFYDIVGVAKATAEKKASSGEVVAGAGGQATLGMVRLIGIAQEIIEKSTAPEAKNFNAAKWLGEWIERPQPALGGKKPADLLDTPTGLEIVARTLGALQSGAYV
jgi:putative toxin-antitoxin system antitoxin component (TIGR02293 family)